MATGASSIEISRPAGGYTDRARAYQVLVDGREVGKLRDGQRITVDVPPGRHEVFARIDWCLSPTVVLELAAGEKACLVCRPNASPMTALWYATLGRKDYLSLHRTDER